VSPHVHRIICDAERKIYETKPTDEACPAGPTAKANNIPSQKFVRDKQVDAHHVRIIRAHNGGALRTMNGGLAHENGWYPSRKARRILHWEGLAQHDYVQCLEVDFSVARMATESVRFEFVRGGKMQVYTVDVELLGVDGSMTLVEIKRDEDDLRDADYRAKLGYVREICEKQGIRFKVVYRHDIWKSLIHRRNVSLFCSRRFVTIRPEHVARLEAHGQKMGADATFGSLAEALEPRCARTGEAVLQALTVARRVEIDLTRHLLDATPITIH